MSQIEQFADDVHFVRRCLSRRSAGPNPDAARIYLIWAAYVLIGYSLIDMRPPVAGWFFLIGSIPAALGSWWIGRRAERRVGEVDRDLNRRALMHWAGGFVLIWLAVAGLTLVIPPLRGFYGSQVFVVMIGLLYFFSGVHFDGHFLWLGPLLIAGGIVIGFIPAYPWTCVGAVIALALLVPYIDARRRARMNHNG